MGKPQRNCHAPNFCGRILDPPPVWSSAFTRLDDRRSKGRLRRNSKQIVCTPLVVVSRCAQLLPTCQKTIDKRNILVHFQGAEFAIPSPEIKQAQKNELRRD